MIEDLKLIPIWNHAGQNAAAVMNIWPVITEGVEAVLAMTSPPTDMTRIYNQLLDGTLTLWVGYMGTDYKGFMTTYVETVPWQADVNKNIPVEHRHLVVVHGFSKDPKVDREAMLNSMHTLEDYAREKGCSHIKFLTLREAAFVRRLAKAGWGMGYTEMIKPLGETVKEKEVDLERK